MRQKLIKEQQAAVADPPIWPDSRALSKRQRLSMGERLRCPIGMVDGPGKQCLTRKQLDIRWGELSAIDTMNRYSVVQI